jgi:uncharacterized protein
MAPAYPTADEIHKIFDSLASGDLKTFFSHVDDNVDWRIMGHSPMSDHYHDKADFQKRTLGVLNDNVLKEPLRVYVVNVQGGGESDQAAVELKADSVCKNGECALFLAVNGFLLIHGSGTTGLKYDMTYCWVLKFNTDRQIERVRAYIDTDLLTRAINENK